MWELKSVTHRDHQWHDAYGHENYKTATVDTHTSQPSKSNNTILFAPWLSHRCLNDTRLCTISQNAILAKCARLAGLFHNLPCSSSSEACRLAMAASAGRIQSLPRSDLPTRFTQTLHKSEYTALATAGTGTSGTSQRCDQWQRQRSHSNWLTLKRTGLHRIGNRRAAVCLLGLLQQCLSAHCIKLGGRTAVTHSHANGNCSQCCCLRLCAGSPVVENERLCAWYARQGVHPCRTPCLNQSPLLACARTDKESLCVSWTSGVTSG